MATIKEIAEKAGVSIGTVDRVLHDRGRVSEETKELILRLVQELDYQPNNVVRGLAIRRRKLKMSFYCTDPSDHPFFEEVLRGAEEKIQELSQYGVEVDVHVVHVQDMMQKADLKKTDGIVMIDMPGLKTVSEWADDNDIPVVYYNIPCDSGLAYVGCDYDQAGRIAAGLCALMTNGRGEIGILSEGDDSVISFRDRLRGFLHETGERFPEMKIDRTSQVYTSGADRNLDEAARQMLREHPGLDVIYLVNPGDYHVCRTIRENAVNPHLRIITNDLTAQQRPYMEDGLITATICQEPERQAANALELLFQYLVNGSLPKERNCYTNLSIHIRQNI